MMTAPTSPRRSPPWRARRRPDAHLLAALRDRARVWLGRRGLRTGAFEGPRCARGPERHPARTRQAPPAGGEGMDGAPGVAAQGAPVVRDAVRVAALCEARLGRRGLRPAARALRAVRGARRALGAPALPPARARGHPPSPPRPEPPQSVSREARDRGLG